MIKTIFTILALMISLTFSVWGMPYHPNQLIVNLKTPITQKRLKLATSQKDPILNQFSLQKIVTIGKLASQQPSGIRKRSSQNTTPLLKQPWSVSPEIKQRFLLAQSSDGYLYKFVFQTNIQIDSVISQFESNPNVIWVQPNYIYSSTGQPNDPDYNKQYYLSLLNIEQAWQITTGKSSAVIAVIDTGVDWLHEDLKNKIWLNPGEIADDGIDNDQNGFIDDIRGWDFVSIQELTGFNNVPIGDDYQPRDNNPMDYQGHGTLVSGIIAAEANNYKGISGTAPGCTIMPVRAGYMTIGGGGSFDTQDAFDAIKYAADNGAQIINLSWGGEPTIINQSTKEFSQLDYLLKSGIDYAAATGTIVIAAAGNEKFNMDERPFIPAVFDNVIAVSAVNQNGIFDESYSNYGQAVDIAAPGTAIYSTKYDVTHQAYGSDTGTSFAAPQVSAVAGLLLSYQSNANIGQALIQTAKDLGDPGKDVYYGYGLIDPIKALGYVDTEPPTISHTIIQKVNQGYNIVITANITDNFSHPSIPSASVIYCLCPPQTASTNWQTVSLNKVSGTLYQATIPSASADIEMLYYYFEVADLNPSNNIKLPNQAPQSTYQVILKDTTGPTIQSASLSQDYIGVKDTLTIQIYDNTYVSPNTIIVGISNPALSVTYNLSHASLVFVTPNLSIDLDQLSLSAVSTKFRVLASDIYGNPGTDYELTLDLSGAESELALYGPDTSTPVINYPNPFNPLQQTTQISYMVTKASTITLYIYSLNLQLVKRSEKQVSAGYHQEPWDGRDQAGDIVPTGVYLVFISATADGQSAQKRLKIAVIK